jgi:surface antigen
MSVAHFPFQLACIVSIGMLLPSLATAQNSGFLKDAAISNFDDKDVAMMMQNIDVTLNDTQTQASHEWKNPASGNSGKAEVLKAFKNAAGVECKRLQLHHLARNGVTGRSAYNFCKHEDKWMVDSTAAK